MIVVSLLNILHGKSMSFDEIYNVIGGSESTLREKLQRLEDEGLLRSYSGIHNGRAVRVYKQTAESVGDYHRDRGNKQ